MKMLMKIIISERNSKEYKRVKYFTTVEGEKLFMAKPFSSLILIAI